MTEPVGQSWRIPVDASLPGRTKALQPVCQLQQVRRPKRRPAGGSRHEHVHIRQIGPLSGHTAQLVRLIEEVDPVQAPAPATLHELQIPPEQRMKRMRYPHPRRTDRQITGNRCSRQLARTAPSKEPTPRSSTSSARCTAEQASPYCANGSCSPDRQPQEFRITLREPGRDHAITFRGALSSRERRSEGSPGRRRS